MVRQLNEVNGPSPNGYDCTSICANVLAISGKIIGNHKVKVVKGLSKSEKHRRVPVTLTTC